MSDPTNPTPADEPKADETFTWTTEPPPAGDPKGAGTTTAASILDSVRDVVDDLAERAGPTVRQLSLKAAELTAIAADKAAPLAKRAGEVTADASGRLASKSREWASELRASEASAASASSADDAATRPGPSDPLDDGPAPTDRPGPA